MDLSQQSIKTNNWSADNFKEHVPSMSCTFKLAKQTGNTGQWIPFLKAVNCMFIRMHVHYQVKHRLQMSWTPS